MKYLISLGSYYGYLGERMGEESQDHIANVTVKKFSDGETFVQFEQSLRGKHVFIFGETSRELTELLLTVDAARRSSAGEITVMLPYFGYARQDKRDSTRCCMGASMIAGVLESMGIDRVVSVDLHSEQIQGNFRSIPFEHVKSRHVFRGSFNSLVKRGPEWLVCSPDAGGIKRATSLAKQLGIGVVSINKQRVRANDVGSMELIGDAHGKKVLIVDDIADTCGTLVRAADLLLDAGATEVHAAFTHSVLSGNAVEKLLASRIETITTTDTLFNSYELQDMAARNGHGNRIRISSCANVLGKIVERIAMEESLSDVIDPI